MSDPYAAYGGAVASGSAPDPYAAYGGMVATPPATPDAPRSLLQKAKDNFNANTQGAKPGDNAVEGFIHNVSAGGGDVVRAIGHAVMHPQDTATAAIDAQKAESAKPVTEQLGDMVKSGEILGPGGKQIVGTVKGLVTQPGRTIGQLGTGAILGEAAAPVVGAAGQAAELAKRAVPASITDAATALRTKAGQLFPAVIDGPPESLVTRAVKPGKNNVTWNADVQKAIPLMKSAEQQLGHPVAGIDDALDAANIAKKGIWQQYQARLGAGGQAGAVIDGNQIADAMINSIDKRTAVQNPGLLDKVKAVADTYRKPIPLDDAEEFLQSANKDLNTYYSKNKVGQNVAQNDPETAYTVAEAQALRDALYSKLDKISGPGAAQLKQAYGSLTNVQKELYGRQLVAARQAPESLSEQMSTASGAGKIAKGIFTASPGDILEGAQNIAVSRTLKARNSSDAMITRAFQAAQPATPFPMPSSPRFAGLIERGPIQTPAPVEGEYVSSTPAPPIDATTRAQRLGLLLPQKTGGPIELEYVPQMTEGERVAALMQALRNRKPIGLPAKSTPIRLPPSK